MREREKEREREYTITAVIARQRRTIKQKEKKILKQFTKKIK